MRFRDLSRQYQHLKESIDSGIMEVINQANFISGEQVRSLESVLANYVGVKHCISCGNGTDAITIALMAMTLDKSEEEKRRTAVFVPDFTFFSSGESPALLGLPTYFVDVREDTYNIDPTALEAVIVDVLNEGKTKPTVVIAVDLFGQPAEYNQIKKICKKYGLLLLEDGAQGFGGAINGKKACSFGDISTTSFFPAKPLGCYGDGGAIFTDNDEWADLCRSIAVHGKDMSNPNNPTAKYNNIRLGLNSRLDTIQASVLLSKFNQFKDYELDAVNKVANLYNELLCDSNLKLPQIQTGFYSSWAQYTLQLSENSNREILQKCMKKVGIPTMVYYKKPMHKQGAFDGTVSANANCPVTEKLCEKVLCLPIHPYLERNEIEIVCENLKKNI